MAWKQLAIAAALLGIATPGEAFDQRNEAQTVMFYYAIPLGARSDKERIPWVGLQIQGKRDYQSFNVDTRLFSFEEGGSAAANARDHRRGGRGGRRDGRARAARARSRRSPSSSRRRSRSSSQKRRQPAQPCPRSLLTKTLSSGIDWRLGIRAAHPGDHQRHPAGGGAGVHAHRGGHDHLGAHHPPRPRGRPPPRPGGCAGAHAARGEALGARGARGHRPAHPLRLLLDRGGGDLRRCSSAC